MMKVNPRNWKGLLLGLASSLMGFGTAMAQNPTSIDVDLVQNVIPGTLEVRVRANGQSFGDVLSALTFTIRWQTTSPATLGTRTNTCPSGIPLSPTTQVTNPSCSGTPTGFNYRTYNGFGTSLLDDEGCPLPADTWFTVMTVPVVGNTGCTTFNIVNDCWTTANNRNFFVSLGGIELPGGTIEPTAVSIGTCTVDCLGVVGGTALPGTPCNDNNACTINDVYTGVAPACGCAGTPVAGPTMNTVSSNSPICAGGTLNLTASATNATGYSWAGPNGFNSTSQNPSIAGATVAATGTYTVTASNGCGTPAQGTTSVIVNAAPTTANAGPDQTVCATTATLAGNTATSGTGAWTLISGSGAATTPGSPTSGVTGLGLGANVFQWTISNAPCTASSDQVTITRNGTPTTSNAGPDQTVCGTSATLAANTATTGTGSWSIISGAGGNVTTPSSPTSGFTGVAGTTYTLRWTISNAPCTASTDDVVITLVAAPTTANAGPDQTVCATTATLAGNTATSGTGTWTLISGSGAATTPGSPTSGVTGLGLGANVFQWTISNAPCTASSDQVTITRNGTPTTSNAGPDQTVCGTSATLAANTATTGTGAWSIISGAGGNVTTPSSPTSGFTGVAGTTYTLRWTISNAPCTASTDDVVITLVAAPTTANAGPDQTVCATTATLAGNTATSGTGTWTLISGSGAATTPGSPTSGVTGLGLGANVFQWTISNAPCTASSDQVTITRNGTPTTSNAGPDQTVCGTSATLAANTATTGTGSWSIISGAGGNVTTPSSPTSGFTGVAGTTYTLRWTISNAPCTASTDDVVITLATPAPAADAGSDQAICSTPGTATMAANVATPGIGTWTQVGGAAAVINSINSPVTTISGMTSNGARVFRWTITNAPCATTFDEMTVNVSSSATWYQDADGDGAGDPAVSQQSCTQPNGYVANNNDNCPADGNKVDPGQCGCGVADTDTDGDGIANCNDNCPNLPGVQGNTCNDNNACTINDVITAGCVCAGTFQDTDGDGICNANDNCPNLAGVQGDACNDNNACTINDVITAGCVCAGTFQDTDGDGICNANDPCPNLANLVNGDPCDDNNPNTENDVVTNCICAGTLLGDDCEGVPGGPAQPGTSCDDADACTTNDVYDANCVCAGTFQDGDGDGICDANDLCDNNTDGDPCDDGDACTINDVLDNCVCTGTFQDSDGDGTCDASDPCPNLANLVNGDPCDDNNANTENDVVTNCICAGTPLGDDCEGVPGGPAQPGTSCDDADACTTNDIWSPNCVCAGTFQDGDGDGICDANDPCDNNTDGDPCDDGDACTINDVLDNCVCTGTFQDSDGDGTCDANDPCPNLANLVNGDPCDDNNANTENDVVTNCICAGTLVGDDCEGVPGGPAQPGTSCDDADACTTNDVYDANCVCAGTTQDSDGDGICDANDNCPNLSGVQGDACNDDNACTINDVITAACVCAGTNQDSDGDGTCDAQDGCPTDPAKIAPGTCGCGVADTDTDGDGLADCVDNCPNLSGQQGSLCDDGNTGTTGDVINANCECVGSPVDCNDNDPCTIDSFNGTVCVHDAAPDTDGDGTCDLTDGCPNDADKIAPGICGCGNDEPGTPCDDGNANTTGDVITANCECHGDPLGEDCLGVPGGSALPGTPCDDLNPNTGLDVWSANCECVGQPIDCLGVPGGTATIGSACNDGNVCTTGDVYNASCVCEGIFQDTDGDGVCNANDNCPNLPGQVGSLCNDNNENTGPDAINANCVCTGPPIGGCTQNLTLTITLDANPAQTTWTLYDATETSTFASGGPYTAGQSNTTVTEPICVPVGCYHLRFNDSGNNGITGGGYVLRDASNRRIIDATVGSFTTTSEIGGTSARTFCVPIGALQILNNWCDRSNLLITSPVYCNSQPGASGYQWWIYNPHGTYNRRVTTTTNILAPVNLNTNPIPTNTWLNLRVRSVFGNNPQGEFGPACRVKFLPNGSSGRELLFDEGTNVTMSLFPNPNRDGQVTLSMEGLAVTDEETQVKVDVYDLLGTLVVHENAVAADGTLNHRMDLSGKLVAGMYMVNVTVDGQLYTQRLVIQ